MCQSRVITDMVVTRRRRLGGLPAWRMMSGESDQRRCGGSGGGGRGRQCVVVVNFLMDLYVFLRHLRSKD